ncbi:inhibitor of KinA [Agreia bicolorata]|uniref:Inhibitor of KinA n=1 Tax=Agreia bicolorata TaxID=110935 RepID=A0A1T4YEE7_9MICO|nr:carboxyltransferase domain-containing protein [Agreia bicolorata]SKB00207.1 inhibitor of KinA [Agreia bicolorata]
MSIHLEAPIATERYGDSAVMVTVRHPDAALRAGHIVDVRDRLVQRRPFGVTDVVSGLESLLVEFDPLITAAEHVEYALRLLADLPPVDALHVTPKNFVIPIIVTEQTAPDLDEVAAEWGVPSDDVIDHLLRSTLTISLLGAAMAPMMAGLETVRPIRRRAEPRTDVPPGSIMVAGTNAIIQPFPGPTGWRVIGRTPLTIVDINRPEPVSFSTGDIVRFERIDTAAAARRDGEFLLPNTNGAPA